MTGLSIGTVSADTSGDFEYTLTDGGAAVEVIGYTGTSQAVVIPSELNGLPVTSIGASAFSSTNSPTRPISAIIPEGVTSIGDNAFKSCYYMTAVTIPSSVTSIGKGAFADCNALTSVTIPNGITVIREETFSNCGKITSITIPTSVTSIEKSAFWRCGLTSLTIPSSVTSIGDFAFRGCDDVKSLIIKDGVVTIGSNAFNALSMTSVSIPKSVTSIGEGSFSYCYSLTSVTFEGNITTIGRDAFAMDSKMTSIWFKGYVAPIAVGTDWVPNIDGILGHAYAGSNFPAPGEAFYGLTMGNVITSTGGGGTDTPGGTDTTGDTDTTDGDSTNEGTNNNDGTATGGTELSGIIPIIGVVVVIAAALVVVFMMMSKKKGASGLTGPIGRSSGRTGPGSRRVTGAGQVAPPGGPVDVFISHAEEDYKYAADIAEGLGKLGYTAWLYERDCTPGTSYLLQTGEAIGRSKAFILIISKDSLSSHQIDVEVERAHEESKPFIPLRVGISHNEFQSRRPLWKQAIGTTTSIEMRSGQSELAISKVAEGLKNLGISPGSGLGK